MIPRAPQHLLKRYYNRHLKTFLPQLEEGGSSIKDRRDHITIFGTEYLKQTAKLGLQKGPKL